MRICRSLLLMVAVLFALLATPVEYAAAAQPQVPVAASPPCSSSCAEKPGTCGHDCTHCDLAMTGCAANSGCGMLCAVAPQSSASSEPERTGLMKTAPPSDFLDGGSIKPVPIHRTRWISKR